MPQYHHAFCLICIAILQLLTLSPLHYVCEYVFIDNMSSVKSVLFNLLQSELFKVYKHGDKSNSEIRSLASSVWAEKWKDLENADAIQKGIDEYINNLLKTHDKMHRAHGYAKLFRLGQSKKPKKPKQVKQPNQSNAKSNTKSSKSSSQNKAEADIDEDDDIQIMDNNNNNNNKNKKRKTMNDDNIHNKQPPSKKRRLNHQANKPSSTNNNNKKDKNYETPKQDEFRTNINNLEMEIKGMKLVYKSCSDPVLMTKQKIKIDKKEKELKKQKKELNRKIQKAEYMRAHRAKHKTKNKAISKATGDKTIGRDKPGRPPIEDLPENEGLLEFYKVLTARFIDGASHSRRRNNLITSTQTLPQLVEEVAKAGYAICRSTLYTRVYPWRAGAGDSKRHYPLLPIKLHRPSNDDRKRHPATGFYFCIKGFALEIAASIGSAAVIFGGFDDKARIPMGIPAASKQGKILVHLEYRITLPDHDYVKAEKHKLIPSVTCYREIVDKDQRLFGDHCRRGTLTFEISKCNNRDCCKPLRSGIREFLGSKWLPTPTIFRRNAGGSIKPAKPFTPITKKDLYGTLLLTRLLGAANNNSIDTYRGDVSKDIMKERTCGRCLRYFANKTAVKRHHTKAHYRKRRQDVDDNDVDVDVDQDPYDIIATGAKRIIDEKKGLYLMVYEHYTEWISLPKDNEFVVKYNELIKDQRELDDELPSIKDDDLDKWIQCEWEEDDEHKSKD